jgi:hypothetical protein
LIFSIALQLDESEREEDQNSSDDDRDISSNLGESHAAKIRGPKESDQSA